MTGAPAASGAALAGGAPMEIPEALLKFASPVAAPLPLAFLPEPEFALEEDSDCAGVPGASGLPSGPTAKFPKRCPWGSSTGPVATTGSRFNASNCPCDLLPKAALTAGAG